MSRQYLALEPSKSPTSGSGRHGSMLLELVTAVSIGSLLIIGIQSCLSLSLKCIPNPQGVAATTLRANRVVDRLVTELETALYITERSATTIGFTVPDRDGDGIAERIRYAWSGTPGAPLTRQYSAGPVEVLIEAVQQFSLTPNIYTVAETYPTVGVEDANESLLIDRFSSSGTGNEDIKSNNWLGQYFTMTLPAGAYAWRPTRVEFMAKKNSLTGASAVQMRPATANLAPADSILEQYPLLSLLLPSSYDWQSIGFYSLEPLPPGGALCLTLQHVLGSRAATLQTTTSFSGLQKTGDSGASWSFDSGKSLVARLYGKLTRSSGTQSINSSYLTSMRIAARVNNTTPMLQTQAVLLNHPELLSAKWELKFDQNPTQVDINGDGLGDWFVEGGGNFNMASLANGVWSTSNTQLNTNPNNNFSKTTIVDLKMQNTSVGGEGATFAINALRSGASCAPLETTLKKQTDGTQTLQVLTKTSDLTSKTLLSLNGLPNQPALLQLIINPATSSVNIRLNDVQYGTFALSPYVSLNTDRVVSIGGNGSTAEFSYARVRVLEQ